MATIHIPDRRSLATDSITKAEGWLMGAGAPDLRLGDSMANGYGKET